MVFGVLEVFGINDVSSDMRIYSDEICKASLSAHFVLYNKQVGVGCKTIAKQVGVLTQAQLCDLLHEFPQACFNFD